MVDQDWVAGATRAEGDTMTTINGWPVPEGFVLVPEPPAAPETKVRPDWQDPAFLRAVRRKAMELWNVDNFATGWSDENRDHYMVRATILLSALETAPGDGWQRVGSGPFLPSDIQVDEIIEVRRVSFVEKWRVDRFNRDFDDAGYDYAEYRRTAPQDREG